MEAEVISQVTGREGTTITIQTTVDLSGSMLAVEEAILASVNEVGAIATQEGLKRFDADGDPIVLGGIKWYSRGPEEKTYQTPYGEVSVERHLYQRAGGGQTYCPMEYGARIVHTATPRFAKMVSHKLAQSSALQVKSDLEENHGRALSKLLIQDLGTSVATVAQIKQESWSYAVPKLQAEIATVGIGIDGAIIRLCGPQWREAMTGSLSLYGADGQREHTIYIGASPQHGKELFLERMEREITQLKALYPQAVYVGIADGAKCNWTFLEQHVEHQIADFYHASEYLTDAADVIWDRPRDKDKREVWLNAHCSQLKHEPDGAQAILKELQAINVQRWPVARAEKLACCITYFTNQGHRMKYAEYQAAGMPIGSGVTEAACKTLVKQRLCRSGMKWSEKGAQVILSLRALVLTASRWNQFWNKINQYGVPDLRRA
jgi:hypothetical protein